MSRVIKRLSVIFVGWFIFFIGMHWAEVELPTNYGAEWFIVVVFTQLKSEIDSIADKIK